MSIKAFAQMKATLPPRQVKYNDGGLMALIFTAGGDMRQAIDNLQSTWSGSSLPLPTMGSKFATDLTRSHSNYPGGLSEEERGRGHGRAVVSGLKRNRYHGDDFPPGGEGVR